MELVKVSDNYDIKDNVESWNIVGTVRKEVSGIIHVSIVITDINDAAFLGNFNYIINPNNTVNVSFDCGRAFDESIFSYGNELVDKVIEQLKG
jgi:hypothetical protein